jgi:hypothetical protein
LVSNEGPPGGFYFNDLYWPEFHRRQPTLYVRHRLDKLNGALARGLSGEFRETNAFPKQFPRQHHEVFRYHVCVAGQIVRVDCSISYFSQEAQSRHHIHRSIRLGDWECAAIGIKETKERICCRPDRLLLRQAAKADTATGSPGG